MAKIIKDISALLPNAQTACRVFLKECERQGLKVRITETYRSQERQNELYAQGRSKPGNKVTWTLNSRHTSRRAWDICQNIKGKEYDTSTGFFEKCGQVAAKLGITWGGRWKTPDRPHFEVSESWVLPNDYGNEEIDMEELIALKKRVTELENANKVYDTLDEMPKWIRDIAEWGLKEGIITGTGDGLGMTRTKAENLVMIKKAMSK